MMYNNMCAIGKSVQCVRAHVYVRKWNDIMIHHMTQRCAPIRICHDRCYDMDKNAVAKFFSQGLVCVSDLRV